MLRVVHLFLAILFVQGSWAGVTLSRPTSAPQQVVIHYARLDSDYQGWNAWVWPVGKEGFAYRFDGTDRFGRIATISLPPQEKVEQVGFIIRQGEWERKDIDGDRFIQLGKKSRTEVWIVSGDPKVYTEQPTIDRTVKVIGAFLDRRNEVNIATNIPLTQTQLKQIALSNSNTLSTLRVISTAVGKVDSSSKPITTLTLSRAVADDEIATLSVKVADQTAIIFARGVLEDAAFMALDADLGARCTEFKTVFRTWSPVSSKVELLLFDGKKATKSGSTDSATRTVSLRAEGQGLWTATIPGDLHGTEYLYRFTHYGAAHTTPDIHCIGATQDGTRSVAVNLDRLTPEGWVTVEPPTVKSPTDEVIYELHVRDYSILDDSCPEAERGTYLGLVHQGSRSGAASGLAYLQELGITAVHLMPIQDFTAASESYNWGYWTAFFNVPESNYASRKNDPLAPILELRTAITALHRAGLRVILDVAYNHTSSSREASPFDSTVPYWFFRTAPDGTYLNDAGCGNSVADERPMVRKYILDSLAFWLTAYRVDGFRFDLLGTHTPETVRAACKLVKQLRPDATLYGEPWTGGGQIRFGKGAQKGMPIAVFNDHLRNAIRGDLDGSASGFATGPGGDAAAIRVGVAGAIDDFTQQPTETVNYASAHDNLSLVDKISKSAVTADMTTKRAMQKLALGIVLVSQGIPFIEGGSELCRTKQGNHNSYEAGDQVNAFHWSDAAGCREVSSWVQGLIALRKAHPALRISDASTIRSSMKLLDCPQGVVAWTLDGRPSADPSGQLLVALNGDPTPQALALPDGKWSVVVDQTSAGVKTLRTESRVIQLPPYSLLLLTQ